MSTSNDTDTEDGQVADIKHLLSKKHFEEAFDRSIILTRQAPENADGWWYLTRAAKGLKRWDVARNAVKETINLVPRWPIAWGEFGYILEVLEQNDEAKKAFEAAIQIDPDYEYGHSRLMLLCDKTKEYDSVIFHGQALERIDKSTPFILDTIALAFWNKHNFQMSRHYYTKSARLDKQAFRYSNLGLIYERPELAQYLDASDAYRRALLIKGTDDQRALNACARLAEKLSVLAHAVTHSGTRTLDKTEFYRFYINPFVLLGCHVYSDMEDYPTKQLQKLKKALVQEIDLEKGLVDSLGRHSIDKSRALAVCDDLLNDTTKNFHWIVFRDKRLCDFLHTGAIDLFTYDESYFPIDTLNALDEPNFLTWLSAPFSRQYDLVLSRSLDQNNLSRIGALLNGRRYVAEDDEDLCFAGASRFIDRRMEPLRTAEKEASTKRPSTSVLSEILTRSNNAHALAPLLNLLPAHFRSFQDEAVRLIRSIAVDCNNKHSDPDLARGILQLAKAFASVSVDVKHQIETDEQQINEIIATERKHEVRLTQGGQPLHILKEGVRKGAAFIASKDLKGVRWGAIRSSTYGKDLAQFHLAVLSSDGAEIAIDWNTATDIDKAQDTYAELIDAMFAYALPPILEKIEADLDSNKSVIIGTCELKRRCLVVPAGWFGMKLHEVPWSRIHTEVTNGKTIISDRSNSRIKVALPIQTTYNAVALGLIAASRGNQQ